MRSTAVIATVGVMCVACFDPNRHGQPRGATFAREGGEVTLVISDELDRKRGSTESRLVAIDVKTGKKLATRILDPKVTLCTADTAGALWCDLDGTMKRVNPRTLAAIASNTPPPPKPSYMVPVSCRDDIPTPIGADTIETSSSKVARTGKVSWNVPLPGMGCQQYTIVDDLVVVAVSDIHLRALGLDAATGAERWRVEF